MIENQEERSEAGGSNSVIYNNLETDALSPPQRIDLLGRQWYTNCTRHSISKERHDVLYSA
jgi:hypothetical protein